MSEKDPRKAYKQLLALAAEAASINSSYYDESSLEITEKDPASSGSDISLSSSSFSSSSLSLSSFDSVKSDASVISDSSSLIAYEYFDITVAYAEIIDEEIPTDDVLENHPRKRRKRGEHKNPSYPIGLEVDAIPHATTADVPKDDEMSAMTNPGDLAIPEGATAETKEKIKALNVQLSNLMGRQRNHYDKLVRRLERKQREMDIQSQTIHAKREQIRCERALVELEISKHEMREKRELLKRQEEAMIDEANRLKRRFKIAQQVVQQSQKF